jgi:TPR repeat protein
MYQRGEGVQRDMAEALRWYRMAAMQGSAESQALLGFAYLKGDGVSRDAIEAGSWLLKAATQGDSFSQYILGQMYERGDGVPKDLSAAAYWYGQAAKQGEEGASADARRLSARGVRPRIPANSGQIEARARANENPDAARQLSFAEIQRLLRNGIPCRKIEKMVDQFGVSFELSREAEADLRKLGADYNLLLAISSRRR